MSSSPAGGSRCTHAPCGCCQRGREPPGAAWALALLGETDAFSLSAPRVRRGLQCGETEQLQRMPAGVAHNAYSRMTPLAIRNGSHIPLLAKQQEPRRIIVWNLTVPFKRIAERLQGHVPERQIIARGPFGCPAHGRVDGINISVEQFRPSGEVTHGQRPPVGGGEGASSG